MTTSLIGPLVAPWNVEQAVVETLSGWLALYVYDIERQNNLVAHTIPLPPAPESVTGGLDFESWQEDLLPMLIVVCNPLGEPERNASIGYSQLYGIDVGVVVVGDDERQARQYAGLLAAAATGALLQRGGMGGLVTRTRMVGAPRASFPDPEQRRVVLCDFRLTADVNAIVNDDAGPVDPAPPADPQPAPPPDPSVTAPQAGITVTTKPITAP